MLLGILKVHVTVPITQNHQGKHKVPFYKKMNNKHKNMLLFIDNFLYDSIV